MVKMGIDTKKCFDLSPKDLFETLHAQSKSGKKGYVDVAEITGFTELNSFRVLNPFKGLEQELKTFRKAYGKDVMSGDREKAMSRYSTTKVMEQNL